MKLPNSQKRVLSWLDKECGSVEEFIRHSYWDGYMKKLYVISGRKMDFKNFDWDDYWKYTFVPMAKVIATSIGLVVIAAVGLSLTILFLRLAML